MWSGERERGRVGWWGGMPFFYIQRGFSSLNSFLGSLFDKSLLLIELLWLDLYFLLILSNNLI